MDVNFEPGHVQIVPQFGKNKTQTQPTPCSSQIEKQPVSLIGLVLSVWAKFKI